MPGASTNVFVNGRGVMRQGDDDDDTGGGGGGGGGNLPSGGTVNQVLAKTSNADFATGWVTLTDDDSGGGGGGGSFSIDGGSASSTYGGVGVFSGGGA